ncbi:MAG TPA: GNAT family N-acetyltransferase, partial [Sphingomonadales bacterium]|nr:GNAT family N-acetyltransferase [Sphingomonadales bacterium]
MPEKFVNSIAAVGAKDWDRLAGSANPFISHAFLKALEVSGSVSAATGWQPRHALLFDDKNEPIGACPLYLKGHSMGEYVFDQAWANAFAEAGGHYYPKLLSAIPFTPVSAPKLLGRDKAALARAIRGETENRRLSSAHVLFIDPSDREMFEDQGYLIRLDQQFHWHNRGYSDFADYLETLTAAKRKTIRRERREIRKSGIEVAWKTGKDIHEADWDFFYDCYNETCLKRWGRAYLTREFFSLIGRDLAANIRLCVASKAGAPFAAALHLVGGKRLYGRYWGTLTLRNFLHFELCYYQAIELAIREGLEVVEAGAQGAHKLFRGYEPVTTQSAHWISHKGFRNAVADFLKQETKM